MIKQENILSGSGGEANYSNQTRMLFVRGVLEETHSLAKRLIDKDKELLISSPEALRGGDRLRIRDYVFEIIEAGQIDGDVICRCRRRFATVIHDRLAAYDYDKIAGERVLSLSNYVEFRQWSAATDLSALGLCACIRCFAPAFKTMECQKPSMIPREALIRFLQTSFGS